MTAEQLNAVAKCRVRECDETEKGVSVAYVDEGSSSFDVSITLSASDEVTQSNCDCGNNVAFCRHKIALLTHIASGKKTAAKLAKVNKKQDKAEALLDEVGFAELKEWVRNLIEKNKDIGLSFISNFSAGKQYHSTEEVRKMIKETVKAVIGTKKSADASQVKKLSELLPEVLKPIAFYYQANVMYDKAFQSFHIMIEECIDLQYNINANTVRISRFIEEVLAQSADAVNKLEAEASWLWATGNFVDQLSYGNNIRVHYLVHLRNIIAATDDENRRKKLISLLAAQFQQHADGHTTGEVTFTKTLYNIVNDYGLLPQYYKIFKPLRFQNEFNLQLIHRLLENGHTALAKKYCLEQIKANYQAEYDVPYLEILKDIYTAEKDDEKLAAVLMALFPFTYNFDDYLFASARIDSPEEKKKWRTGMLNSARGATARGNSYALEFRFKLLDYEKNYKKMFDYIDSYTPYSTILKYFEPLFATSKDRLIERLTEKNDDNVFMLSKPKQDDPCFPALFALVKKYYDVTYLKMVIKKIETPRAWYVHRPNRFAVYMKEQLGK